MDPLAHITNSETPWPKPLLSRSITLPFVDVEGLKFHFSNTVVSSAERELLLIGTSHVYDPLHPQLALISEALLDFSPTILLTEALPLTRTITSSLISEAPSKIFDSQAVAINHCGESGYAAQLLQTQAVSFTPEPSLNAEIQQLEQFGFLREDIFSYYGLRWNLQLPCNSSLNEQRAAFDRGMNRLKGTSLEAFLSPNTIENAHSFAKDRWGSATTFGSPEWGLTYFSPMWSKLDPHKVTLTNKVVEASCYIRDLHLLQAISLAATKHNRIAVVYGCQHATTCLGSIPYALENVGCDFEAGSERSYQTRLI
jgi:hypothetical protein